MARLFGTDGVRGVANTELTGEPNKLLRKLNLNIIGGALQWQN